MVFSSVVFLFFFLPIAIAVVVVLPERFRNPWLLACSLFFYAWGSGALVLLLLVSTVVDYLLGRRVALHRAAGNHRGVRLAVGASVVVNLSLLGYFKYANFLVDQINSLGLGDIARTSVTLPVGISFFTFQSMSYTIDVARGRAEHLRNPLDFALYVSLFPQLVAGPIVRFHELSEQIRPRVLTIDGFSDGVVRFSHGLMKKVLIADSVAPIADAAFANEGDLATLTAWVGVFAYAIQIYFDFSGYSDMAIGLGQMLGFRFPENFLRPYSAVSVTDFWRRWHITLSSWFRDYVYIPLGGGRRGTARTYVNLSAVFLLTGLWHGAKWTFVVWGIYHGTLLIIERLTAQRPVGDEGGARPLRRVLVFVAVLIGWVFFRADNLTGAFDYLATMFSFSGGASGAEWLPEFTTTRSAVALVAAGSTLLLPGRWAMGPWLQNRSSSGGQAIRLAYVAVTLPIALILVASSTFSPFLYFQF